MDICNFQSPEASPCYFQTRSEFSN